MSNSVSPMATFPITSAFSASSKVLFQSEEIVMVTAVTLSIIMVVMVTK